MYKNLTPQSHGTSGQEVVNDRCWNGLMSLEKSEARLMAGRYDTERERCLVIVRPLNAVSLDRLHLTILV